MDLNFLSIEEHDKLSECQLSALTEVNSILLNLEKQIKVIINCKRYSISNPTRTRLIAFLDLLNKIIITPDSKRTFSYHYFYNYKEVSMKLADIDFSIEFPCVLDAKHSLDSFCKKSAPKINKEKVFEFREKISTFTKIMKCQDTNRLIQAQNAFHDFKNYIENLFEDPNDESAKSISENYNHILDVIDNCISDVKYANDTTKLIKRVVHKISSLKKMETLNEKTEEGTIPISPFTKRAISEEEDDGFFLKGQKEIFHTPERAKNLHTNLISIAEDKDRKIIQLQDNLQNEIEKNQIEKEKNEREITKIKHTYHKKIKKLKESLVNFQQLEQEANELREKVQDIEDDNDKYIQESLQLNDTNRNLMKENHKLNHELSILKEQLSNREEETIILSSQADSSVIKELKETIEMQEIEIVDLDSTNKNLSHILEELNDTISNLTEENSCLRSQVANMEMKIKSDSEISKKEKALSKAMAQLQNQTSKSLNDIQKILNTNAQKINRFNEIFQKQIFTNPDEMINQQLEEFNQMKVFMTNHNIISIEDLANLIQEKECLDEVVDELRNEIQEQENTIKMCNSEIEKLCDPDAL
ncbi:hypothetical protein TRFO_01114 [Tritrichomonas foetus]|uniref:Uncharacterized protein n=1 Tax=Tritrichomonas foetus TaxID=1144522 RepID=A0A1J4KIX8_9EUKA|nr:hypothetical protein TRFO_01114 [Tritrichomonas foetus]|eukprot:OHT11187.1 hypothetical protein TRFO_01114 [Tritrichomonas foetus]